MKASRKVYFVFGSNLAGRHGLGAAKHARFYHDAVNRIGKGFTGYSYALPTKDEDLKTLPLNKVKQHVRDFIHDANHNPSAIFRVTKVGCGLAGFKEKEIAPLFKDAPSNCLLPYDWSKNHESNVGWCLGCHSLILEHRDLEHDTTLPIGHKSTSNGLLGSFCKYCEEKLHIDKSIPNLMREYDREIRAYIGKNGDVHTSCKTCNVKLKDGNRCYVVTNLNNPTSCDFVCVDCLLNWHDANMIISVFVREADTIEHLMDNRIYNYSSSLHVKTIKGTKVYFVIVDKRGYKLSMSGTAPF